MIIKRLVCLSVLSLSLIPLTAAQHVDVAPEEANAQSSPEQQKARQELERKALLLLDEVINDAKVFRNAENRLIIKIIAADLLWPRNETRARALFKEAVNSFNEISSIGDDGDDTQGLPFLHTETDLRRSLIQAVARHDPQWARDLLRTTRPATLQPQVNAPTRTRISDRELQLEQGLAAQIAASDPKQALEVAEQTLAKGLTYELLNTLSLLMRKDREAAARLASKIVTKLQTENLTVNEMVMHTALSLLRVASKSFEAAQTKTDASAAPSSPLLNQQELRDLSEMISVAALNSSETSYAALAVQPLLPEIEKYAPARGPQLRRRLAAAQRRMGRYGGLGGEFQEVLQNGTVDAMLEAAPKAPDGMRNYIYHRAAMKALEEGNADRAHEIANENISEPSMRKFLTTEIERRQMMRAAAEGKMEQTRQMLSRLRTNEERVSMLTQLSSAALAKNEKKVALALLEEARSMIGSRARNFTQLGAQLQVARSYARLDAARSLSILEPVIEQLNELIAAGALLGGFYSEQIVRDDEIQLSPLHSMITMFGSQYAGDLNAVARADFDRLKAAADRFQRSEVRALARLLIIQSVLSPPARGEVVPMGVGVLSAGSAVIIDDVP